VILEGPSGTVATLVMKQCFHIELAVDTPSGLVMPVIRDVDRKGVADVAKELDGLSEQRARTRKAQAQ